MQLKEKYDYIIIGSGFGGSVSALRLAEKGYAVLVIEKGKKYNNKDFAKTNWNLRKWMWLPELKLFGIQKLTFFRHISVLSGVGVGGGSLVYANTLPKPKSEFFNHGSWSDLENWEEELNPFYDVAWKMLGAATNPILAESDLYVKELASQINKSEFFEPAKVGVFFGEEGKTVKDPYFDGIGPARTGCIHCGACMTGCRHNAKNSLDKNYLYLAQKLGVDILPEHRVTNVISNNDGINGYSITFKKSTQYFSKNKSIGCKGIIFSGGVLGTVPLLLKLKKNSLHKLSSKVGKMVRTNNEALIVNTTLDKEKNLSKGIAIGSVLQINNDSHLEPVRYGKGSGFWRFSLLPMVTENNFFKRIFKMITALVSSPIKWLKILFVDDFAKRTSILLFMQHLDSTLSLKKGMFGVKTSIDKGKAPSAFIPQAHDIANKYAKIINSKPQVMFTETITGIPSTAHILGGACMGKNVNEGVIDSNNKVFCYENMYVFDGSMISANPGVNPSLTITAISERGMSKIKPKN